jgi:midasin
LHLLPDGVTLKKAMKASPQCPSPSHVRFDDFWVEGGEQEPLTEEKFIITPTVMGYLRNLARAVLLKKYPILLQGPTSSGKTSLISYLAGVTGHRCIRINNHEHTDIQDYIGSYMSDSHGRLVFNEGPLIQALRNGYWIILDELNLAPSEVLEALNRLLDDNRELFVPELQEVVIPHRHFMLFATQNPPGIYAGRKTLSRAFRSRFLEIHVDDIPDNELQEIIEKKCSIAPSYSRRIISVMRDLQRRRSASNVFAGKHGYITPRDLFRWANRPALSYEDLAINGYFVLAERLRDEDDKGVVLDTLEKVLKAKVRPHEWNVAILPHV